MKNILKKLGNNIAYIIIGIILASTIGIVYAANVTVPQATQQGDIPIGASTGNYFAGHLVAGTNITINTSTPGQITLSATGGGSVSGGTPGFAAIWNSATSLTTGIIKDNGTVAGINATSSTVSFNIQGSGALNPFNVASSTGTSILFVGANGQVGINSSSPITTLSVVGSIAATGNLLIGTPVTIGSSPFSYAGSGSNGGTATFQNTSATGYSGLNLYDNNTTLAGSIQYGNASAGVLNDTFFVGPRSNNGSFAVVTGPSANVKLTIATNGSTTIASLGTGVVLSSSGALFNGLVNLTSQVSSVLPIINGGTGTTTPGLIAGTNITVTGTWPFQTINSTGGSGTSSLPYGGQQGLFLGNTASGTPAWLTPLYVTVCSSGCNYTATGTNDNVGINAAITAVNAAGGGTVLIKAGTYALAASNGQINLRDKTNINLIGEGDGTKIFIGGGLGIEVASSTNIQIEKIYIDGSGQSHATFNADQALRIYNSHNVKVNNNTIVNSWGFGMFIGNDGRSGIGISTTSDITIINNYLSCQAQQDCIGGGKNNTDTGLLNTADVNIIGNTIIQNTFSGGVINSNMDANCIDMVAVFRINFESNNCKGAVVFGNEKYPNTYSKIVNNIIDSPLGGASVSGEIALEEGCNDCTVGSAATGTPAGNLVMGNILKNGGIYITGNGTNPYTHLLISSNTIQVASSSFQHFRIAEHGIQINNAVNSLITGNNITAFSSGQSTDGIFMQSSTGNIISNNYIRDFATGLDMASANQENLNTFSNVTTRIVNPGTYIDSNGANLQISNNAAFIMSSASSTAMVAQTLGLMNSSNDIFILPNAGDSTHPVGNIYFGYNSPATWTFGGSCCGGSVPTAYNFNSSGTNTWNVNSSNVLQITSSGILLPQQSASQLLGTDGSKNVISYAIPLTIANGGTGTTTSPSAIGQLMASSASGKWGVANLIAGSNITITTSTPGQITIASSGGGTITGSGNPGFSTVWTSTTALGNGVMRDNGVVSGINATSSTISFNVQGSGTLDPFAVASSSGTQFMIVTQAGNVGIGTSTPQKLFHVFGNQAGGIARIERDTSTGTLLSTLYGTYDIRLWSATTSSTQLTGTGPTQIFTYATSGGSATLVDIAGVVDNASNNGKFQIRTYLNGTAVTGLAIDSSQFVGMGSTTPFAKLTVVANSAQTLPIFNIATSTGVSVFKILASGDALFQSAVNSATAFQVNNSSAQSVFTVSTSATYPSLSLGTSSITSIFFVQGTSTQVTMPFLTFASSSGTTLFQVDSNGYLSSGGTAPTTNSGSVLAGSTNVRGRTIPAAAATTATLTFANGGFGTTPYCTATQETGTAIVFTASATPTTLVLAGTTIGSDSFTYQCWK